jgi:hypothetical protein
MPPLSATFMTTIAQEEGEEGGTFKATCSTLTDQAAPDTFFLSNIPNLLEDGVVSDLD